MIERLPELVNADPAILRWGRHLEAAFMVEVGATQYLLTVRDGRIEAVEKGPLTGRSWRFAIRASEAAWRGHWRKAPAPGYTDLYALLRRGELRFEGDLRLLMAYLLYLKLALAAPRRLDA